MIRFHDENRGELEELGQGAEIFLFCFVLFFAEIFLNLRSKGSQLPPLLQHNTAAKNRL